MYILESISHIKNLPFKFFIANIESCAFHWHYDYEIVFVLKGSLNIRNENKETTLTSGDIYVFNSRQVHALTSPGNNICLFIQFSPEIFEKIGSARRRYLFNISQTNAERGQQYTEIVGNILNIYIYLQERKPGHQLHLEGEFYTLVGNLLDTREYSIAQNSPVSSSEVDLLNQLNDFIEQHYAEQIGVEDVCRALAMSPAVLYPLLKNVIGLTIGDMIRFYRIREAKFLLLNSDYSIYHIAHRCGYQNEMSFYRAFKKELHMTPNEFRKQGEPPAALGHIQGYIAYDSNEADRLVRALRETIRAA